MSNPLHCKKCGAEIQGNTPFCAYCGAPVNATDTEEATQLPTPPAEGANQPSAADEPPVNGPTNDGNDSEPGDKKPKGSNQKVLIIIIVAALLLAGGVVAFLLTRQPSRGGGGGGGGGRDRDDSEDTALVDSLDSVKMADSLALAGGLGDSAGYDTIDVTVVTETAAPVRKLDVTVNNAQYIAPQGSNTYYPANMLDGNPATAWTVYTYDVDYGDGIDVLRFNVDANTVDHITIVNGYGKSYERFYQNARAGSIFISRVPWTQAGPDDILYAGPLKDTLSPQTLPVSPSYDNSRPTNTVYVRFPTVIEGDKYYYDFCISEIEFYGTK